MNFQENATSKMPNSYGIIDNNTGITINCNTLSGNRIMVSGDIRKIANTTRKATILVVDTNFNIVKKPSIAGFTDSLCANGFTGALQLINPDTIYLDDLNLRKNLYLSINKQEMKENTVNVFPNPNNGKFNIQFNAPISGSISFYDINGKKLMNQTIDNSDFVFIELEENIKGMVFIEILDSNQKLIYKTIIVN